MEKHHLLHLSQDNGIRPQPAAIEGWEEDLKKWPQIMHTDIFSKRTESVAADSKKMINFKSSEVYW